MRLRKSVMVLALALGCVVAPLATAEEPIATALDTSDAEDFLGSWKLTLDIMNRPFELILNIAYKFLENIVQGDHADGSTVLVDYQRDVCMLRQKEGQ